MQHDVDFDKSLVRENPEGNLVTADHTWNSANLSIGDANLKS
jgi:hypothetical protein